MTFCQYIGCNLCYVISRYSKSNMGYLPLFRINMFYNSDHVKISNLLIL